MIYGHGQVHVQNLETDLVTKGIFVSPALPFNDWMKIHEKLEKKKEKKKLL